MNKRRGKILVASCYYYRKPELLQKALAEIKFLPLRVEMLAIRDCFELYGCSPEFDELGEGMVIPEYYMTINTNDNGEFDSVHVQAA